MHVPHLEAKEALRLGVDGVSGRRVLILAFQGLSSKPQKA